MGFRPLDAENVYLYSPTKAEVLDGQRVSGRLRGRAETKDGAWLYPNAPTPDAANTFTFRDGRRHQRDQLQSPAALRALQQVRKPMARDCQPQRAAGGPGGMGIRRRNLIHLPGRHDAGRGRTRLFGGECHGIYGGLSHRAPSRRVRGQPLAIRRTPFLAAADRNPVDVVRYFDDGPRWPQFADGGGSSLELRDLDADTTSRRRGPPAMRPPRPRGRHTPSGTSDRQTAAPIPLARFRDGPARRR